MPHGGLLAEVLPGLRWGILAAALAITVAWPVAARTGHAVWLYLLIFFGYNLIVEALRRWRRFDLGQIAGLDLAIAGLVYWFDAEPAGPLFITFYVGVLTAAVCFGPPRAFAYTAAAVALAAAIAPTLPRWEAEAWTFRQFASRLAVLGLVGLGSAVLASRLAAAEQGRLAAGREAARLEELDRLRADFVASASHDLRTPLTAIQAALGMLETSAGGRLQPEERNLLANARRNADRLRLRVDDLLTFNLLRTATLRIAQEPLDLRAVAAAAVATVRPLLQQKGQTLAEDLPVALPVWGDGRRLEQVVVNLLDNAHRHTPAGTTVSVSGWAGADQVGLVIRDDGPGIPVAGTDADVGRLRRVPGPAGGWGLGLPNVRGIAELHGGRARVESDPGRGTAVWIALPRRVEEPAR